MEDILKSGFFEDGSDNNIEKEFTKKHCKKRRPKNPFYVEDEEDIKNCGRPGPGIEEDIKRFDSSSEDLTESAFEAGEADQFQQLYEELQTETEEGGNTGGEFEEIYENLVVGSEEVEEVTGSYLPPEIYKLHMESHKQRMGILTKYVEQEEPVYDIWSAESTGGVDWSTGRWFIILLFVPHILTTHNPNIIRTSQRQCCLVHSGGSPVSSQYEAGGPVGLHPFQTDGRDRGGWREPTFISSPQSCQEGGAQPTW